MIIIKLWGGTCNQLFQLAFGYVMGKVYNDEVCYDTNFFLSQPKNLGRRKLISKEIFPNIGNISTISRSPLISFIENRYVSFPFRHTKGLNFTFGNLHFFMEQLTKFYPNVPYKECSINYYDGYWQSEKYFKDYEDDIKGLFTPSIEISSHVEKWRTDFNTENLVAIHIRRGDYIKDAGGFKSSIGSSALCNMQYYIDCIEYIKGHLNRPVFCFFSDDIEWCKEKFGTLGNAYFINNKGPHADLIDLFSISVCDHGIMSLSTFSWWGNWLRIKKKDSVVICPSGDIFNEYFIPNGWIKYEDINTDRIK